MSGWVPLDAAWWPAIADALPRPWPREAVLCDLRWWADQERMGRARRPGRGALIQRWGWSEWASRSVLAAEAEWCDPLSPPAHLQPTSSAPPADLQPRHGRTPTLEQIPPAHLQPTSSAPPADLPTRDDLTLHTAQTPDETTVSARATPPPVVPADRAAGGLAPPRQPAPAPAEVMAGSCPLLAVAHELAAQRAGMPVSVDQPTRKRLDALRRNGVIAEDLRLVWDYVTTSDEQGPVWLRENGHVRWHPLADPERWRGRLDAARAWDRRGRVDDDSLPEPRSRGRPPERPSTSILALLRRAAPQHETITIEDKHGK